MHITDYGSPIFIHSVIVLPKLGFPARAQGLLSHTKKQNPRTSDLSAILAQTLALMAYQYDVCHINLHENGAWVISRHESIKICAFSKLLFLAIYAPNDIFG